MAFYMCGIIKALNALIAFCSASNKKSLIVDGRNGMIILIILQIDFSTYDNGVLSSVIFTNTSAPQGTVSATFLFSLYAADCRSTDESCPLVKFADDTKLVGKNPL